MTNRIYHVWDRLVDFDASRNEEALRFLLSELKALSGADDAVWIGVVRMAHGEDAKRDHQLGWRGRAVVHLDWTDVKRQVVSAAMKAQEIDGGVPSSIELAKRAGHFRTLVLRELHDMESFAKTEHYRNCFIPFGITDRMWCVFPVNEDCEVAFILDRFGDRPSFGDAEKEVVSAAVRGLKWFHRHTMLAQGILLGDARLSPRESEICALLLSHRTEKEIAEHSGLAHSTARGYIKQIYRKFGVNGRAGFMALWLGTSR